MRAASTLALALACGACGAHEASAPPQPTRAAVEDQKRDPRCDDPAGVPFHGRRRLVHGANYAWHDFGTDFGGLAAWGQGGVRANEAAIDRDFAAMAAAGASVVRWWVFPDLRGDAFARAAAPEVPRLREGALLDLDRALAIAERHDVYLLFTLFSFDAFRPPTAQASERIDLAPFVREPRRIELLLRRVVAPFVERAAASPLGYRVFAWDLFNEPEWAVADLGQPNMCDAADDTRTDCVSYAQMQGFLGRLSAIVAEPTRGLPERERPLITVGSVSPRVHRNWETVPQDFHELHFYDVDYAAGPFALPADPLPTVLGEFPSWGLAKAAERPALDATGIFAASRAAGFAGSLGWTFNPQDPRADWPALASGLHDLAVREGCRARF